MKMKKDYENPEYTVDLFTVSSVITTSDEQGGGDQEIDLGGGNNANSLFGEF